MRLADFPMSVAKRLAALAVAVSTVTSLSAQTKSAPSPVRPAQPATSATADVQQDIPQLVAALRDRRFSHRQRAMQALIDIGPPAIAGLRKAAEQSHREIRLRCLRVLSVIESASFESQLQSFLAARQGNPSQLGGWRRFRQVAADRGDARQLFVEMHRAEHELMELLDGPAEQIEAWLATYQQRANERAYAHRTSQGFPSALAVLLAVTDERITVTSELHGLIARRLGRSEILYRFGRYLVGPQGPIVRRMLAAWLTRDPNLAVDDRLTFVRQMYSYNGVLLRDAVAIAYPTLKDAPDTAALQNRILSLAMLGGREHAVYLTPLLKDRRPIIRQAALWPRQPRGRGSGTAPMVCDVALAAALLLAGEDPRKFGFTRFQTSRNQAFDPRTATFDSDEARQKAHRKWAELRPGQRQ